MISDSVMSHREHIFIWVMKPVPDKTQGFVLTMAS